jgi:DNA-binding CsgD family transcriptional regulator
LADALTQAGVHKSGDHLTLVGWRVAANQPVSATDLVAAARAAHGRFDHGMAERLAQRAIEAIEQSDTGHSASTTTTATDAAIVLGAALDWQGRHKEAEDVLTAVRPSTDEQYVELANAFAPCLFYGLGRRQEAEDLLHRAQAAVSDPYARDSLNALWAQFLLFAGKPARALEVANTVLTRKDADQRQIIRATAAAAPALALLGRTVEARSMTEAVLPAAVQLGAELPRAVGQLFGSLIVAACLAGDFTEAHRHSDVLYQLAMTQQDHGVRAGAAAGLGYSALYAGLVQTARRWLREASGLLRAYDPTGYRILALAGLAHAAALAGEVDEANAALNEATASWTVGAGAFDGQLALARAWSVVPTHGLAAARDLALQAADRAAELGQPAMELLALHDVARLRGATEVAPRLAGVAANVDGRLAPIMAAHATALVEANGDALLDAAQRFEGLGAHLLAAEAAAAASAVLAAAGLQRSARAAATRAATLAAMCEGAHTPGLTQATPAAVLTDRELEIASLTAVGLSNREIADRLILSTRTVDNHLHRIYAKVGASHRAELASLLNLSGQEARKAAE